MASDIVSLLLVYLYVCAMFQRSKKKPRIANSVVAVSADINSGSVFRWLSQDFGSGSTRQ